MITIWNQREVFIGNHSKELQEAINKLSDNKIKFKCKIFNQGSAHFFNSRILSLDFFNLKNNPSAIYYVYVHEKDYEKALILINNG